jgi:hypothetical protein
MRVFASLLVLLISCANAENLSVTDDSIRVSRVLDDARSLEMVSLSAVVESATGHRVLPVDREKHRATLATLTGVIERVMQNLNHPKHPIHAVGRINEASRFIEDELLADLNEVPNWKCSIPKTSDGGAQRSGYPDLFLQTPDGNFYLDPKLYSEESEFSSLRTFYYEPRRETNKIQADASHLLIGIMHTGWTDGRLTFTRWSIIDLATIPLRLKAEFQASNREIYSSAHTLAASKPNDAASKK